MSEQDVELVAAGYDTVYAALPNSETFRGLWRTHASGEDYPDGFEHISFLTLEEMRDMARELRLHDGATLVDLACGMGGPGLWIAREANARLIGLDISHVALEHARARAAGAGLADRATYARGEFARTGLDTATVDGIMTVDALQYAPDKQAAVDEIARVLRPDGRFVFACFEFDPVRVAGLPIFGADPVGDYRPHLERGGFDVLRYEETPAWRDRVTAAYQAVIDAKSALEGELGEVPYNTLTGEMRLTLELRPYRRRVFAVAQKR
jgi:ubiquinone/menaquinone biosynthesis C-methylase UbiE